MGLSINGWRCQGHGKCYMVAAAAFEPDPDDDWGRARVLIPDPDPGDKRLRDAIESAIGNCPEQAISWEEGS